MFVAINVVWLVMTIVARKAPLRADEAYGECRAAIRGMRPEAKRIRFPTTDLIRVTRRDSVHHVVRGYYASGPSGEQTWYQCELHELPGATGWKVDTIVFTR